MLVEILNLYKSTKQLSKNLKKSNLEHFIDAIDIKNDLNQKTKLLDKHKQENKNVYIYSIPKGLSASDFEEYKEAMEQQLDNKIDIKYENKRIIIEEITSKLKSNYPYTLPTREEIDEFRIPIGCSI